MSPLRNPTDYAACLVKCLLPISDVSSQFSCLSILILAADTYYKREHGISIEQANFPFTPWSVTTVP